MCMPWEGFEEYIIERARKRRDRDTDLIRRNRPEDRGRNIRNRPMSDLCYAIDQMGEQDFVGYSANAGLITQSGGQAYRFVDTTRSAWRLEWFEEGSGLQNGYERGPMPRPFCNCAEACAMALARSEGVPIERLFFVSFFPVSGKGSEGGAIRLKPPCPNCQRWLVNAGGYWGKDGPVCNPKGPRDPDKDSGGGVQRTPLIIPGAII